MSKSIVPLDENLYDLRCNINEVSPVKFDKDADDIAKRIAERLQLRLEILKVKPRQLAKVLINKGVIKATSDCTIRHILVARRKPSINLLFEIARATDVQPGYYLDDDNPKWMQNKDFMKTVNSYRMQNI